MTARKIKTETEPAVTETVKTDISLKEGESLVTGELAYTVPTLAELVQAAHSERLSGETDKSRKLPRVRKGDLVAEITEDGQIGETYTVARNPSSIVILLSDRSGRRIPANTDKLVKIADRTWQI